MNRMLGGLVALDEEEDPPHEAIIISNPDNASRIANSRPNLGEAPEEVADPFIYIPPNHRITAPSDDCQKQ